VCRPVGLLDFWGKIIVFILVVVLTFLLFFLVLLSTACGSSLVKIFIPLYYIILYYKGKVKLSL
jgi:heme/copper-type cytochrome/quinol oxidase subunit 4